MPHRHYKDVCACVGYKIIIFNNNNNNNNYNNNNNNNNNNISTAQIDM